MEDSKPIRPERIVLRTREEYELECTAIIEKFFDHFNIQPMNDYFWHLCPANSSSTIYIVLDLYCQTFPTIEPDQLVHEVFQVRKPESS